jgi:hypothetical protein
VEFAERREDEVEMGYMMMGEQQLQQTQLISCG